MKSLRKGSLSSVLAKVINIVWWLEWIAGATLVMMACITARVRRGFALQIPINFSTTTIRQARSVNTNLESGIINTTNGIFSLHIGASWQNLAMLLTGFALVFFTLVIVTYQLKEILKNFEQGLPFNKLNMARIRNVAFVLMAYSVAQWAFAFAVNVFLNSNFQFKHLDLTYDFNISCLLTGIALLIVEEIFKAGLSLEEEQQLTI